MTIRIDADLLIPGRGEPITDGTVVTEEAVITFAGPTADAPHTPGASLSHVPVVMPGLWECHGHVTGITSPDVLSGTTESVVRRSARSVGDLSRTLMGGVTSMREVGGLGVDIQPAIAAGDVVGPTVYGAGKILSTTGGHGEVPPTYLQALFLVGGRHRVLEARGIGGVAGDRYVNLF